VKTLIVVICLAGMVLGWLATHFGSSHAGILSAPGPQRGTPAAVAE